MNLTASDFQKSSHVSHRTTKNADKINYRDQCSTGMDCHSYESTLLSDKEDLAPGRRCTASVI